MTRWIGLLLFLLVLGSICSAACAEQVVEVWRNALGGVEELADAGDGSVWVINRASSEVLRLAPGTGSELAIVARAVAPPGANRLAANTADGSCWIGDCCLQQLVHVGADGTEIARATVLGQPGALSVDTTDGSCWAMLTRDSAVVHVGADGTELSRTAAYTSIRETIAAVPGMNSCWMIDGDTGHAIRLEEQPDHTLSAVAEFEPGFSIGRVAVDASDLTFWVASCCTSGVARVREEADHSFTVLATTPAGTGPTLSLWPDPSDHACWVTDGNHDQLARLSGTTGGVTATLADMLGPQQISGDSATGTLWVLSRRGGELTRATTGGTVLAATVAFSGPESVGVGDGSVWVYDRSGVATRLDRDGTVLAVSEASSGGTALAVDASDNSCWIAECCTGSRVLHLDADGNILTETPMAGSVYALAIDPRDGSCWAASCQGDTVSRLQASDGAVVDEVPARQPVEIAVDPADGSCWVVSACAEQVTHFRLNPDDSVTTLSTTPFGDATTLAVDPADSSCLVGTENRRGMLRIKETLSGAELIPIPMDYCCIGSLSVDPVDQSIWLADVAGAALVHVTASGEEISRVESDNYLWLSTMALDPGDHSLWATNGDLGLVMHLAIRPEADFSASITTGTAPLAVSFTDLSAGHPTSWSWSFGDGAHSTQQNPSHTYAAAGLYDVSLTVSEGTDSDTALKEDYVTVFAPLAAGFSADVTAGPAPLEVSFSDDTEGGALTWLWDFGDGTTSTEHNPTHTYTDPGFYDVGLSVTSLNDSDSLSKQDCVAVGFADTPADHWAFLEEIACAEAGIVTGYPDGTYDPDGQVSRAQMAVFVARAAAGGEAKVPSGPATATFTDVATDYWGFKYVEYCGAADIVKGYPDGSYHPEEVVTRGQMAVYVARAIATPTGEAGLADYVPPTSATFSDVTKDNDWSWCYKHVEYCSDKGVVTGYPDGSYQPGNPVSRDQMAVYMQRAFKLPMPT